MRLERIGFEFQNHSLLVDLTVRDIVELSARLLGDDNHRGADTLIERFSMEKMSNETANIISRGEAQRLRTARAPVNDPRILRAGETNGNLDLENGRYVM